MLTKVEVHGLPTSPLELVFSSDASTDPIYIRHIDGLDPVKGAVNSTPNASSRGESYSGTTIGKRNLVFLLGFNPNWDDQNPSTLRQLLYTYFMPEQEVEIRFFDDVLPTTKIVGIVEDVVAKPFSKDVEPQISIICVDPDFVALVPTVLTGNLSSSTFVVNNPGNVTSGIHLVLEHPGVSGGHTGIIRFYNTAVQNEYAMDISPGTVDDDYYLELDTTVGQKFIWNKPVGAGEIEDLLFAMTGDWPQMDPGENEFLITPDGSDFEYTLTYYQRFGGL